MAPFNLFDPDTWTSPPRFALSVACVAVLYGGLVYAALILKGCL